MPDRRRLMMIAVGILLLGSVSYFSLRLQRTRSADHQIDAFFGDYRAGDAVRLARHLALLSQPDEEVQAIIARHSEALRAINPPNSRLSSMLCWVAPEWPCRGISRCFLPP
jgi:hypothetical protein